MDKHLIKFIAKHRAKDESVLASVSGYKGKATGRGKNKKKTGVLVVTETRVVFYRKGFIGEIIESIPIKSISSIERSSILTLRTIRFHTSNDDLRFSTTEANKEERLLEAIESQRSQPNTTQASPAPTANNSDSPLDQLKKLGELRDAKVISVQEFETTKERILATV